MKEGTYARPIPNTFSLAFSALLNVILIRIMHEWVHLDVELKA